jgi:hypothetical protein
MDPLTRIAVRRFVDEQNDVVPQWTDRAVPVSYVLQLGNPDGKSMAKL